MILVAEDEVVTQRIILRLLESMGYQTQLAQNGRICLEAMNDWVPDLLILDIMMPEMNGIEVLREVRKTPLLKDLNVIMLTSRGEREIVREALSLDVSDFILKPVMGQNLTPRIRLQTFRPSMKDIRDLMKNMRFHDETLFNQTGLKDLDSGKFDLYPLREADGLPICVRVPRFVSPDQLAVGPDEDIANSVVLYGKGVRWKQIWPIFNSEAEMRKLASQPDPDDVASLLEEYS